MPKPGYSRKSNSNLTDDTVMGDEIYKKLYTLYTELLNLPSDKQKAFIEENADSAELKEKLLEFLDTQEQADSFFDELFTETVQTSKQEEDVPDKIGPYEIVAPAGRGGMSTVYKARHELHNGDKYVALKVLRKGLDTEDIIIRFHQERKLLSGLNHPNIAGFLDAGSTDKGRPWIAMDYIDGLPITEYCKKYKLGFNARLKLFRKVCEVVQYAHQQLVIHRDLKPDNIMVTDDGNIILLDFGIAKIFEPDNPEYTTPGFKGMTPEYASPEQKRGLSLSTSSDQYSLGVILYKLLTGIRAEDALGDTETYNDLSAAPLPKPPSAICSSEDFNDSFSYEELGLTPAALQKELSGDIDTIILKCLQPDPNQRYSSLDGLIKDIDNYFVGNPISARTPSIGYQARKFIKRNKIEVSVAVGFILTVCFLAGFAFYYAIERDRFAQELEAERDHAEAVSGFMTTVFQYADPIDGDEIVADAEAMIDYSETEVLQNKNNRSPRLTTTFLETLTTIRMNIGQYEEAAEIANKNLNYIRDLTNDELNDELIYQVKLTSIKALGHNNEFETTREVLNTLESEYAHVAEEDNEMKAYLYHHKSWIYFRKDYDFDNALTSQRKAVELAEKADIQVGKANFYQNKSSILRAADREDEAIEPMEKAVALAQKEYGESHPYTASILQTYATMLRSIDNYEQAAHYSRKALEIREDQLGKEHPGVASSYFNLGRIYRVKGQYEKAKDAYETSLHIRKELYGENNYRIGSAKNSLGVLYRRLGEYEKAIDSYNRALEIYETNYGEDHPQLAVTLNNLGFLHQNLENYDESIRFFRRALAIRRETYGDEHTQTTSVYNNLARSLYEKRNIEEAAELYKKVYKLERDVHEDYETAVTRLSYYVESLRLLGYSDESVHNLEEAIDLFGNKLDKGESEWVRLKVVYGIYLRYNGDYEQSGEIFERLTSFVDDDPEGQSYIDARIYSGAGFVETEKGNYEQALEPMKKAHSIMVENLNQYTHTTSSIYNHLGQIYHKLNDTQKSIDHLDKAISIQQDSLDNQYSEFYARANKNLAEVYLSKNAYNQALDHYKNALESLRVNPNGITMVDKDEVLQVIATTYDYLGDPAKSDEYLEQVTSRDP